MDAKIVDAALAQDVTVELGKSRDGELVLEIGFGHGPRTNIEALPLKVARDLVTEINRVVAAALAEAEG
jgi:hypothetical protein